MIRLRLFGGLSLRDHDQPVTGAAAQPRRLAVLAVLACAGERGITRERLLDLLWPDADEERGRNLLKQAIHHLRRALGGDAAIAGQSVLRLDDAMVPSDLAEFRAAIAADDLERAVRLHVGPLLDGVRVPGVPDFERWAEAERETVARQHATALERLAVRATERGDHAAAVGHWLARAALEPLSARIACRLMEALANAGDTSGALRHAQVHAALLDQELGVAADPDVVSLAERLRTTPRRVMPAPTTSPPVVVVAPATVDVDDGVRQSPSIAPSRGRRRLAAIAAVVLVAIATIAWRVGAGRASSPSRERLVAVGRITGYGVGANDASAAVGDMLATNLARMSGLRVVSSARMYELLPNGKTTSPDAVAAAARLAGASEIVDGTLTASPGGVLRLDVRRTDVATGRILAAESMTGRDLFALVDSGTARLARTFGGDAPSGSIADVTTRSLAAYRFYMAGLQRFYADGDRSEASHLFDQALREDSTFAMAAYYSALSTSHESYAEGMRRFARAERLAVGASERERLVIRAGVAAGTSRTDMRAIAESLLAKYPDEVVGHYYLGAALLAADEYEAAVRHLNRVVALDSGRDWSASPECRACDALAQLVSARMLQDSLPAAEREARRWIRMQPRSERPWMALAQLYEQMRPADAPVAWERAQALAGGRVMNPIFLAEHAVVMRDFVRADRMLREARRPVAGTAETASEAAWYLAVSLREQGRLAEALEEAHRVREPQYDPPGSPDALPRSAVFEAQLLFEQGRLREAAAEFDSVARWHGEQGAPSVIARNRAWVSAHAANAYAALHDRASLAARADTIAHYGVRSLLGRDQRLVHHARGLQHVLDGDDAGAVAEFRAAIRSYSAGYTRTNLELAHALERLGRPRDAVAVLQPVFRGPIEASNLYVTRSEAHAQLAKAWDAAGNPDSAIAHYAIVARDWSHGDPPFRARADSAASRIRALGRR